jgi:transcriptional regulator with XRE-family HTH domain
MFSGTSNVNAGRRLRAERERLRLSTREVERLSRKIAEEKSNHEYALSHAWLTEVEFGKFLPSIYKLYSLTLIYKLNYSEVLGFFGINTGDIGKEEGAIILPYTHLIRSAFEISTATIEAPLELRSQVRLEDTNLLSRMFGRWGEIPVSLLHRLNLRTGFYGYIGRDDYTLFPLIRPGSFVQIDTHQRKINKGGWQNEFDRPIYFVELRDGYACSWCEISGHQLTLIPSPQSRAQARHVQYPENAEIIGRVTAVAMNIAEVLPE